jgi:hypothetical protein
MNIQEQYDRLAQIVNDSREQLSPCCLCQTPTHGRGLFLPTRAEEWGGMPGKCRALIYPLCEKHKLNRKTKTQIENWIKKTPPESTFNFATVTDN